MHGAKVNRGKTRCNNIKGTDGVAMRGQKQGKKSKTFTHNGQCTTFLGGGFACSARFRAFANCAQS